MEGGSSFNSLNFSIYKHKDAFGINLTGAATVVNVCMCPSTTRYSDGGRDGVAPDDRFSPLGDGYGYNDYGPTVYADISPVAGGGLGATLIAPFRDKTTRANGRLKQGMTRIAEITDGTSNTIAIAEDAGALTGSRSSIRAGRTFRLATAACTSSRSRSIVAGFVIANRPVIDQAAVNHNDSGRIGHTRWSNGGFYYSGFTTAMPPNSSGTLDARQMLPFL